MKFHKLELEGFGKFSKYSTFTFDNGLNFINGMNEAGKSTLLEAIMASIFKYNATQIEPFFCWGGSDVCKVSLTYSENNGDIYRITSDYKNNRRKLEKIENEKAIELSTVEKNISPHIRKHFGFDDKKVFENTSFIKQSQMAILEDATTKSKIKDMIEEVLAGRSEVSATKTIQKLRKFVKDGNKTVAVLNEKKYELDNKLNEAIDISSNISNQSADHEKISQVLKQKKEEFNKLEKNKKLFDEKEDLLTKKKYVSTQINNIDGFIKTLSEGKQENIRTDGRKEIPIILIVIGMSISIAAVALSFPIGAIFGIPFIIYGIIKLVQQPKTQQISPQINTQKIAEYQNKKGGLINQLAVVEARLEDYKLVNFTIDDFNGLESLKQEVEELKEQEIELKTSVKTTTGLVVSPEELQEKINSNEEKLNELNNKILEYSLAADFLEKAQINVQQKITPVIENEAREILSEITNNHYKSLRMDEESLDIFVNAPEIDEFVDISYVSQGTKDQIYFTVRTILVDILSNNSNLPLILDDPFHNFDDERLRKTIDVMNKISKNKQIIMMSHRPYHNEFDNFKTLLIEL